MNIFLHHELDVSVHSFSSSTLLISVMQDQILGTHLLERMAKDRDVLIPPAENMAQLQKGINEED